MQMLSNKKVLLPVLGVVSVAILLFITLVGGIAYAWTSNKNVPVFSSLVEVAEQATWDASKSESELVSSMFSPLASLAADEDGQITNEELQKFFAEGSTEVESYDYDFTIYVKASDPVDASSTAIGFDGEVTVNLKGDVSQKEDELLMNSDISVKYAAEGTELTGKGEIRLVDETLYAKADSIPTFGSTSFSEYQGKWYSQDISEYLDEVYSQEAQEELSDEDLQMLYDLITSDPILNNIEKMPDEVYGNVRTNCYKLDMDGNDIADLMKEANELSKKQDDYDEYFALTESDFDDARDLYDRVMIEWCAGRKDNLPYKYVVEIVMGDEEMDMTLRFDAKMSNYGKTVNVDKPSDATSFEALFEELYPTPDYDDTYLYDDTYDYDYEYEFDEDYYDYDFDEDYLYEEYQY